MPATEKADVQKAVYIVLAQQLEVKHFTDRKAIINFTLINLKKNLIYNDLLQAAVYIN